MARKNKSKATTDVWTLKERQSLSCKKCGDEVENLSMDVRAVTCSRCCILMSAPPELPARQKTPDEKRPRGWQFRKEYRSPNGTLYRRGEQVNEEIPTKSAGRAKRSDTRPANTRTTDKDSNGRDSKKSPKRTKSVARTKSTGTKSTKQPVRGRKATTNKSSNTKSVKRKTRRPSV